MIVRLVPLFKLYDFLRRIAVGGKYAVGNRADDRRAEAGGLFFRRDHNGYARYVRLKLAPNGAFRAAAGCNDALDLRTLFADMIAVFPQHERAGQALCAGDRRRK